VQAHELRPSRGARKNRKRIGRGNASGQGTYAGKGVKGQQARAGSGPRPGFEGGQTPLIRRLPTKRGFRNPFRVEYAPVNLRDLARLPAKSDVTPEALREAGIIKQSRPVKLLALGEIDTARSVRVHRVSAAARAKIEAAGGTVEELTPRREKKPKRERARAERPAEPDETEETDDKESDDNGGESESTPAE